MGEGCAPEAVDEPKGADVIQPLLDDLQRGVAALHDLRLQIADHEASVEHRRRLGQER